MFKAIGIQKLVAVTVLTVLFMFFQIFRDSFTKYSAPVNIFDSSYYTGFMAIDITLVTITGGIDLSIGTVCICCSLISGTPYTKLGLPISLCVILAISMGGLFGLANRFMVSIMGLPTFIATPGTMMVTRGLGSTVTDTATVTFPQAFAPSGSFRDIFKLKRAGLLQAGIPTGFALLITPIIPMIILLNKARPGCYILPLESNKEATRFSGVNVVKWGTLTYIISGLFAGLTGVSYVAVYSTLTPGTGNGSELGTIAGITIGGTSLASGVGSIPGTLAGILIMSVLKTGLPPVGVQPHYQLLITGFVLIVAIFVDVSNRRKQGKD